MKESIDVITEYFDILSYHFQHWRVHTICKYKSIYFPGMQQPPTCSSRQLSKLKRFLTTLQQFGSDISPEIGERVRALIVSLVVRTPFCFIFEHFLF